MNEDLKSIIQSIGSKSVDLKSYVIHHFSLIVVPRHFPRSNNKSSESQKIPASTLLYGLSALSAIGAVATSAKVLCLGLAVASGYAGYKLSKNSHNESEEKNGSSVDLSEVKNNVTTKVIDIIKHVSNTWDSFMELNQKKVHKLIEDSSLTSSEKDVMMSKVLVHDVIDVRISDFSTSIMSVNTLESLNSVVEDFKNKILTEIDEVSQKQIEIYQSVKL